jgi:hypothetical protein
MVFLFGIFAAGCAPTYRLVPREVDSTALDSSGPGSTIVRQWEQYRITVRPLGRKDLPKSLRSAYTVFQAIVENTGEQEAPLSLSQFALLDSSQNQRFPCIRVRFRRPPRSIILRTAVSIGGLAREGIVGTVTSDSLIASVYSPNRCWWKSNGPFKDF